MTSKDLDRPLTSKDKTRFAECEACIAKGLGHWIEVGKALLEIRDHHLYRRKYTSFAAYCEVKWELGKAHTYRLMDGAALAAVIPVENERQARELLVLDDAEEQAEAFSDACELSDGSPPTAKQLKAAVKRKTDSNGQVDPDVVLDGLDHEVNPKLRAAFAIRPDLLALARQISAVKGGLVKHLGGPGAELLESARVGQFVALRRHVLQSTPYCACPSCEGDECEACEGRGWIPEHEHKKLEAV